MPGKMSKQDETDWERAKQIVCGAKKPSYREACAAAKEKKKGPDADRFYALVVTIFKKIKAAHDKRGLEPALATEGEVSAMSDLAWDAWERVMDRSVLQVEDRMEIRTEATDFKPGDQIAVTTKVGRTMLTGVFVSTENGTVRVRAEQDRIRDFPTDLYNFYKIQKNEDLAALAEGDSLPAPTDWYHTRDLGPFPIVKDGLDDDYREAVQIIKKIIGGDLRWANEIWIDLGSIGQERTMKRHRVGSDMMDEIMSALRAKKLLTWE